MAKTYLCPLEVRGYELDSYGHVNHAVYISYLEHARWKLLQDEGVSLKRFNELKLWPVISQLEVKYLKPTFLGDRLEVRTRVIEHGKTNFTFGHEVYRGESKVFEGTVRAVMVNENGRPSAIPPELGRIWSDQ